MNSQIAPSLRPHRRFISPRARRALTERGLDIASLQGSGPNGRIVEADVLRAQTRPAIQAPQPFAPPLSTKQTTDIPIPQMTLRAEVDTGALLEMHGRFGDYALRDSGLSWTPGDFLLCVLGRALHTYPAANRMWCDGAIVDAASIDIGLLSDDEAGQAFLIRDAGHLNLLEAARQRQSSESDAGCEAAQSGAMMVLDASSGRADEARLPLPSGFSGSLGIGRIAARPFVANGELCVRPTLHLNLCVDTRIWSAGLAARFLGFIVEHVEEPNLLVFG